MKELTVEASKDKLNEVLEFVNTELENNNCPPELRNHIEGAVDEIFANIAEYSYHPTSGKVTIGVAAGEEILIRFMDSGKPYNPLEAKEPDLSKPAMERELGGLGIFLVKKFMDTVDYARLQNKNILTITKTINSEKSLPFHEISE